LVVVGFELRAFACQVGALPVEQHPKSFFAFIYFSDRGSCFCPGLALDHNSTYASHVTGITHLVKTAFLIVSSRNTLNAKANKTAKEYKGKHETL
jgi:hypothetical protein